MSRVRPQELVTTGKQIAQQKECIDSVQLDIMRHENGVLVTELYVRECPPPSDIPSLTPLTLQEVLDLVATGISRGHYPV